MYKTIISIASLAIGSAILTGALAQDNKKVDEWRNNCGVITVPISYGDTLDEFGYKYKPEWMDVREYRELVLDLNNMDSCAITAGDTIKLYADTIASTNGTFYHAMNLFDDSEETYYQFRSYDNEVWWLLTESEIGYTPEIGESYTLTYDNNGTTAENKPCDCPPEWECECEVYDDKFIELKPTSRA